MVSKRGLKGKNSADITRYQTKEIKGVCAVIYSFEQDNRPLVALPPCSGNTGLYSQNNGYCNETNARNELGAVPLLN